MTNLRKRLGTLGLAVAVTAGFAYASDRAAPPAETADDDGAWSIQASGARIIGGYGDNFAYDGDGVRPIRGEAQMTLDTEAGTGQLEITLRTTPESGPIRFSAEQTWEGEIRIVQRLNTSQMDQARIEQEVWLHGDTGNEAPVMPRLFNYFATWGPSTISVNGEQVVPMIGSHTMLSEQARGSSGRIVNTAGEVYSPMISDKTGFTDPSEIEFHYVAHTTQPDQDNFPPHTAWIHLHFSNVEVLEKPADVAVPYTAGQPRST